jgi:hypothetical protein
MSKGPPWNRGSRRRRAERTHEAVLGRSDEPCGLGYFSSCAPGPLGGTGRSVIRLARPASDVSSRGDGRAA